MYAVCEFGAVTIGLEADNVEFQQRPEYGLPPRKLFKHIRSGKRNMQEETQPRANALFSHIASREHQMIIMDPDKITFSCRARRSGSKFLIHAVIFLQ